MCVCVKERERVCVCMCACVHACVCAVQTVNTRVQGIRLNNCVKTNLVLLFLQSLLL